MSSGLAEVFHGKHGVRFDDLEADKATTAQMIAQLRARYRWTEAGMSISDRSPSPAPILRRGMELAAQELQAQMALRAQQELDRLYVNNRSFDLMWRSDIRLLDG